MGDEHETPGWVMALVSLLGLATLVPVFYLIAEATR